jgi:hypothetical protein
MIFKGKSLKQVHDIIKDVRYDGQKKVSITGYEYGIEYRSAGFTIDDRTPLWSEIHDLHFIEGFKKGYYYKNVVDIVAENITDNITDCTGVSKDYPHYINSFDVIRRKMIKIILGIIFEDGRLLEITIQSIDRKIMFGLVSPTNFDELINYPLVEINNQLITKREALDDLFVQYDSKGFYVNEEF